MRFHMLDRIEEICYGKYITAVKCITLADDVFNEHFPGYPVFPGSLILEALAQLSGSFFELNMKEEKKPLKHCVLSIVNKMKFRKPARPGDRLVLRAEVLSQKEDFGVAAVTAYIDNEICAEGELTFSFINIQDEKLLVSRMELYKICMKDAKIINIYKESRNP